MNKRFLPLVAVLFAVAIAFTGCGKTVQNTVGGALEAAATFLKGNVTGEIGKTYSTQWFEFNVKSINQVSEYAGYKAKEGNVLVDVVVTEKNIFDQMIPMGTFDFYIDNASYDEFIYPIDPIDPTMMPLEFELQPKDYVEYHMVYEVPAEYKDLSLMYTEVDETDKEGATFTINFKIGGTTV